MVTQEIVEYVQNQLNQGFSKDVIRIALVNQGWTESDIAVIFSRTSQVRIAPDGTMVVPAAPQAQKEKAANLFDLRKLKPIEWFALAPMLVLFFQGGAIGAAVGMAGGTLILKVMRRSSWSSVRKVICIILILFGTVAMYLFLATIFMTIISSFSGFRFTPLG